MDFSEQYLTYSDYRLLGGTLDIMPFNLLELKARQNIDNKTMLRLKNTTIPVEVKACMFELVEGMAFDGAYKDANAKEKENYINNIINNNLLSVIHNGTPLLYSGI